MKRSIVSLAVSACLVSLLGATGPARAQNYVTFVSESGNDANTCETIAQACRELGGATGAISKTPSGGVIHVLPGEYVAFPVDKSLDIIADGGQASVVNTVAGPIENIVGNAGIAIVVGASDVVRVRGFILNADNGIAISSAGGIVYLENNTLIAGLSDRYGIIYSPSSASELYVRDTTVARENDITGGGGILIKPTGSGSAKVVLDNVTVEDNVDGIVVDGSAVASTLSVNIRNSVISGSTSSGIAVTEDSTGKSLVVVEGSSISGNGVGILTNNGKARVWVRNSTIANNTTGISGSKITSGGGNLLTQNTVNGTFSATEAQQ